MRLRYAAPGTAVTFDDPNLVSRAGLLPVMRLAEQAGLLDAVADRVSLPTDKGSNPAGKVATIVADPWPLGPPRRRHRRQNHRRERRHEPPSTSLTWSCLWSGNYGWA